MKERKWIRLKDYDYSQGGYYFVTVCTHNRKYVFGNIVHHKMLLNETGKIVLNCWNDLIHHYANIMLDEFIIMPNHIHGIIVLAVGAGFPCPLNSNNLLTPSIVGAETAPLHRSTLGQIVAYFKYQSTKRMNARRNMPGISVWQRNYYDHVIRNEQELFETRKYVQENPIKWDLDPENQIASL